MYAGPKRWQPSMTLQEFQRTNQGAGPPLPKDCVDPDVAPEGYEKVEEEGTSVGKCYGWTLRKSTTM